MTYYKVLNADATPCSGGTGKWFLANGEPAEWMPEIANIEPCKRGYHLCERGQLVLWLGPTIWEAEGRGKCIRQDDKVVFAQARLIRVVPTWNKRMARLFACDCAELVLSVYAKSYPGDNCLVECIAVARRYANGEATADELAAASAAAWAASSAASLAAASASWAASSAASSAAPWAASWAAARAASWAAARAASLAAAAWAASSAASRAAQTECLFEYLNGVIA